MTNKPKQSTSEHIINLFAIGLAIGVGDATFDVLVDKPWVVRVLLTCLVSGGVAGVVACGGRLIWNWRRGRTKARRSAS